MDTKYYVYILECRNGKKYYGHTGNLKERLMDHARGHVKHTRNKLPVKLVYCEECNSRSEAFKREMQLKNGRTKRETIDKLIDSFNKQNVKGLIRTYHLCRPFDNGLHKRCAH